MADERTPSSVLEPAKPDSAQQGEAEQIAPNCSKDELAKDSRTQTHAAPLVVGVGASAGGLDAFRQLLSALPADTGMALLLVQHLSPTHKSIMVELLSSHSSMPVVEATDGLAVQPNHVYMIPPDRIMAIQQGCISLRKREVSREGRQLPIDEFFISLADDATERSAGVILSGTGSDGTAGIKAIKEAGGVVLVEDPQKASYPGMPKSAAATGLADFVLPIPQLAQKLADFARQPHLLRRARQRSALGQSEKDLLHIIETLHLRTGYDFREYKKPTLSRRIQRRMGLRNISEPTTYANLLNQDDYEASMLFKDFLIGVTAFFRDADAFADLTKRVLRPLVRQRGGANPVRVWVAGCTTGEEAYSISILLAEEFSRQQLPFNAQIFATDVDEDAVNRARAGHYSLNIVNEIPEEYLRRYFDKEDGGYQVNKRLRESVTFAVQNLVSDPPFSKLDLICCRNVLIYLENSMQDKLLKLFHFSLMDDGFLFLGSSESTTRQDNLFKPIAKQNRIFQKTPVALRNTQQLNEHSFYSLNRDAGALTRDSGGNALQSAVFCAADATREALLSHYAPPAVLINGHYEVQYFQGETGRYLHQPQGEPTSDLCAMARYGLKRKIRAVVQKTRKTGVSAYAHARRVDRSEGSAEAVTVAAHPVRKSPSAETFFLITFSDDVDDGSPPPPGEQLIDESDVELSSQLEYELYATRQDLQSTIEQLETSNEELKASNEEVMSMNEELQSSNEELETSREELQSLNEELNTVNNQLEDKVGELESVNNDLSNLLSSTDIATVFLDLNLRIRRFTPATHKIIHLIDSDVGRPLADLALNFRDKDLIDDARAVLEALSPSEKQVVDDQGKIYLRRITLYRTMTNRIEGVVLTFTDVTDITGAMSRLKSRERQQALVARFGQEALSETDLGILFSKVVRWAAEALDVELCKVLELRGDELFLRAGVGWQTGLVGHAAVPADSGSQGGYTLRSKGPVTVADLRKETRFRGPDLLEDHQVISGISVVVGSLEEPWGVLGAYTRSYRAFTQEDVNFIQATANALWAAIQRSSVIKEMESQAAQLEAAKFTADASNHAKSAFLANMSHEIRTPLTAILGYTDLLHMEFSKTPAEDYLRKIKVNGQNLLEIINDVLDLSKVEADRIEVNPQLFSLKTLLAELQALMHLRASEKRLDFKVASQGDVPNLVFSDVGRTKQILVNLISNAIKFTREGSVRLMVSASPAKAHRCLLTFHVVDTGIGIAPDLLPRVFDPFEQADHGATRTYGGTGLGLTISKRIAGLLGGSLEVESELDKGSVFSLNLPVEIPPDVIYRPIDGVDEVVQQVGKTAVNSSQLNGVHVLVVDDVEDVLTLIQAMLQRAGAQVSTATNGQEAIERIYFCEGRGTAVDIVLMDTMMPVVDGFTAVKLLRGQGFIKPIVALTAAAMTNDRERCLEAGCDDYLSKPVRMEKLLAVLSRHAKGGASLTVPDEARVLIIEDNRDAGEAIETLLSLSGYNCRLACDGRSGLELARQFLPEVILLDLTLPDMDGYQVARALDKTEGAHWQLVALSGQDLERQQQKLRRAGFVAWLQKPAGRDALANYFPALAEEKV